jgi:hypothetical protein
MITLSLKRLDRVRKLVRQLGGFHVIWTVLPIGALGIIL